MRAQPTANARFPDVMAFGAALREPLRFPPHPARLGFSLAFARRSCENERSRRPHSPPDHQLRQARDIHSGSGRISDIYVDARLTTMSPQGLAMVGAIGLERLRTAAWNRTRLAGSRSAPIRFRTPSATLVP